LKSISFRLGVGFGITLILILFIGLLGIVNIFFLSSLINEMHAHPFSASNAIMEANRCVIAMQRSMKDVVLSRTPESIDEASEDVDLNERRLYELFGQIEDRYLGDPKQIEDARKVFSEWKAIRNEEIALMKAGRQAEAAEITKRKAARQVEKIQTKMDALIESARENANEFLQNANNTRNTVVMLMAAFLGVALVVGSVIAVYAIKENNKGLSKLNCEIEERKRIEKDLEESRDRLVNVNKELESFSYSVSHDLKTPLRHVIEYAKILEEMCPQHVDSDSVRILSQIGSSAHRMNDLIDSLLDLSRISRHTLNRAKVNLSAIATVILDGLKQQEPSRAAVFNIEDNVSAEADEGLMGITLQNLLDNAWKFSKDRQTTEIQFGTTEINGTKTYFVKDNGAGFSPLKADLLFQPFQRLHTQKEFAGTGIGLATVQRIIHRHGGKIWAESKPGEGATFFFTLSV
jgi:signal transduction histidine kinase